MSWLRFWKRDDEQTAGQPGGTVTLPADRPLPPHLAAARQRAQDNRAGVAETPDGGARRLAELERRRQAALFEVEQGELASTADNPWEQRIALLTEALATVNDDLERLDAAPPEPFAALHETPITDIVVSSGQPPSVGFTVGDQRFQYDEEVDWAERGHQVAMGELRRLAGDPARLVPTTISAELVESLTVHLTDSLFVFASDLRDRQLDAEPFPDRPTLADLGRPCAVCGGWRDWRGRCQACARRNAERGQLKREADRLLDERAGEVEERHRLVERMPIARRRLADIETQLDALETARA
ncbi:MAG: hypothetical protein H0W06_02210 [Chloroflexia bacterium]|nr:hypothetical protein [Chloroflexia bacterium]